MSTATGTSLGLFSRRCAIISLPVHTQNFADKLEKAPEPRDAPIKELLLEVDPKAVHSAFEETFLRSSNPHMNRDEVRQFMRTLPAPTQADSETLERVLRKQTIYLHRISKDPAVFTSQFGWEKTEDGSSIVQVHGLQRTCSHHPVDTWNSTRGTVLIFTKEPRTTARAPEAEASQLWRLKVVPGGTVSCGLADASKEPFRHRFIVRGPDDEIINDREYEWERLSVHEFGVSTRTSEVEGVRL